MFQMKSDSDKISRGLIVIDKAIYPLSQCRHLQSRASAPLSPYQGTTDERFDLETIPLRRPNHAIPLRPPPNLPYFSPILCLLPVDFPHPTHHPNLRSAIIYILSNKNSPRPRLLLQPSYACSSPHRTLRPPIHKECLEATTAPPPPRNPERRQGSQTRYLRAEIGDDDNLGAGYTRSVSSHCDVARFYCAEWHG